MLDLQRWVPRKVDEITASDAINTAQLWVLRPGWLAFTSSQGVHIVQLQP